MNRTFIITTLLFLTALPAYTQHTEDELDRTRDWFRETNAKITQYKKVEYPDITSYKHVDSEQYSREGEELYSLAQVSMTKSFEDGQLVKIVVAFIGDREDLLSEYYVRNGSLFFVDKVKTIYHKPKWHDAFQASEKSIVKNRFYIKDDQLISWVNPDIMSVPKKDPSYQAQERMIVHDYQLYISID